MELWQAIILGIVEGITEYLPVSSTGHLLVTQQALGMDDQASHAFAIAIQAGAILAVLGIYRHRVRSMTLGVLGREPEGARLAGKLMVAFMPAAVVGLLFDEAIEGYLFGMWPIVFAWLVGGVAILALKPWLERVRTGTLDTLSWRGALTIGLFQCLAMWPGTSRSLVTILGALAVGLALPAAVEFSFLLGLITLGAATAYMTLQHGDTMLAAYGWGPILVGLGAAWLAAVLAIRGMVAWLSRRGLELFAWWRIAAAALVGTLVAVGFL